MDYIKTLELIGKQRNDCRLQIEATIANYGNDMHMINGKMIVLPDETKAKMRDAFVDAIRTEVIKLGNDTTNRLKALAEEFIKDYTIDVYSSIENADGESISVLMDICNALEVIDYDTIIRCCHKIKNNDDFVLFKRFIQAKSNLDENTLKAFDVALGINNADMFTEYNRLLDYVGTVATSDNLCSMGIETDYYGNHKVICNDSYISLCFEKYMRDVMEAYEKIRVINPELRLQEKGN